MDTIEHADFATEPLFQAMKAKGIVLVPTLWPRDMTPHWPDLVAVDAPPRLKSINGDAYQGDLPSYSGRRWTWRGRPA